MLELQLAAALLGARNSVVWRSVSTAKLLRRPGMLTIPYSRLVGEPSQGEAPFVLVGLEDPLWEARDTKWGHGMPSQNLDVLSPLIPGMECCSKRSLACSWVKGEDDKTFAVVPLEKQGMRKGDHEGGQVGSLRTHSVDLSVFLEAACHRNLNEARWRVHIAAASMVGRTSVAYMDSHAVVSLPEPVLVWRGSGEADGGVEEGR
jgi:hypothetical protein